MTPAEKEEGLSLTKGTKTRANGGFTLVEVLVAIAILGVVVTSMGGCLVVSQRVNARSQNVIEERAAVTNVVEKLMAEGAVAGTETYHFNYGSREVIVTVTVIATAQPFSVDFSDALFKVTVTCGDVKVLTYIHAKPSSGTGGD